MGGLKYRSSLWLLAFQVAGFPSAPAPFIQLLAAGQRKKANHGVVGGGGGEEAIPPMKSSGTVLVQWQKLSALSDRGLSLFRNSGAAYFGSDSGTTERG